LYSNLLSKPPLRCCLHNHNTQQGSTPIWGVTEHIVSLRQVGGHLASIHSAPCHRTPHSRPTFNSMHSISRVTYPHYHPRTTPVMAMALQDDEEVNAMGWPPNQSHRKLWLHGFYSALWILHSFSHLDSCSSQSHFRFSPPLVRVHPSPPLVRVHPSSPPLVFSSSPDAKEERKI
jgi:hypothetical protein